VIQRLRGPLEAALRTRAKWTGALTEAEETLATEEASGRERVEEPPRPRGRQ
jgi:hypothetical protein